MARIPAVLLLVLLLTACGAFSLIGFPLDDVWHRLFGQDVTLWGPTHLMLIGGAQGAARVGTTETGGHVGHGSLSRTDAGHTVTRSREYRLGASNLSRSPRFMASIAPRTLFRSAVCV